LYCPNHLLASFLPEEIRPVNTIEEGREEEEVDNDDEDEGKEDDVEAAFLARCRLYISSEYNYYRLVRRWVVLLYEYLMQQLLQ
jgi:hypothetical protein